jgi:hypothetical protein
MPSVRFNRLMSPKGGKLDFLDNKMKIEELPSVKHLKEQITGFSVIFRINKILRHIGLGSKKIAELKDEYDEMRQQFTDYTEYPRKFNEYFSKDGWLAHDSMNFEVLKRAVDEYESKGKDEATKVLLDYYGPDQIEQRLLFFVGVEELRIRRKFIDYALVEHKAGRYYSAIPLLLMVIDGATNDATGKGFHASGVTLDVWDSLTTADGAIYGIKDIFQKGRKKTCTEPIDLPYRHGILHGMDLEYDNPIVTAKCWCFLFSVRDWLGSKKSEAERIKAFKEETKVPSLREIAKKLDQTNRLRQATEAWEPRTISGEYLEAINTSLVAEEGRPESIVLTCLDFWKKRNYGNMAKLFWTKMVENPKKYAGELRQQYSSISVGCYSVVHIVDEAPAITKIDVKVTDPEVDDTVSYWKFRLIREDESGAPVPVNLEGGRWQIVWIQQTKNKTAERT